MTINYQQARVAIRQGDFLFIGWCYTAKRHGKSRILKVTSWHRAVEE